MGGASGDQVDDELEQALEADFELGEIFKTRLIKHAVDWFTGKALEYEENAEEDVSVRLVLGLSAGPLWYRSPCARLGRLGLRDATVRLRGGR